MEQIIMNLATAVAGIAGSERSELDEGAKV
jgi:hypothetical protein